MAQKRASSTPQSSSVIMSINEEVGSLAPPLVPSPASAHLRGHSGVDGAGEEVTNGAQHVGQIEVATATHSLLTDLGMSFVDESSMPRLEPQQPFSSHVSLGARPKVLSHSSRIMYHYRARRTSLSCLNREIKSRR